MLNRPSKRFYEFDSFRIDLDERRLMRGSEPIPLTPKVFDMLVALVENNGHTLKKDELIDRVWAESFVEDGNLNRNISMLRKVLGEDSHAPRYIRTVPKLGYRFEADVREVVEQAEEISVEKVTKFHLAIGEDTQKQGWTKRMWAWTITVAAGVLILGLSSAWVLNRKSAHAAVVESRGTVNDEAYELYRRGRALWQDRSVGGLHNATLLLEQAIAREPNFALAHAALADAYAFDGSNWKKAESAANEAIRLDPNLGQPHATIGFIRTFWNWQPQEAEIHFKKAVALSPDYATAHQWYGINLAIRTLMGAALAEMQRAVELEPRSPAISADLCQMLYFARKYEAATEQCNNALEMDQNFFSAHEHLYNIYTARKMYNEAVDAYFRSSELNTTTPVDPTLHSNLRRDYEIGGIEAFWRTRIEMHKKPNQNLGFSLAKYHARLGETEEAIRWLMKARDGRDFEYIFFVADPAFENIGADPKYRELRQQFIDDRLL